MIRQPRTNYTGVKVHRLTGVEYMGNNVWRWRCDCGNERIARAAFVVANRVRECSICAKGVGRGNQSLPSVKVGQRFGKLVITKYFGSSLFEAQCDCGETTRAQAYQFKYLTQCKACTTRERVYKALLKGNI